MRILFYAHSSTLYGANRSLIDLILGLKKYNPEIEELVIIPALKPLGEELLRNSINFKSISHYNWFYNKEVADKWRMKSSFICNLWYYKNKYSKIVKNCFKLKKHLKTAKQFNPDLIYINSSLNPMGLVVSDRLGIKRIWHHRETINEAVCGFYLEDTKKFIKYFKQTDLHIYTSKFLLKQFTSFENKAQKVVFNGVVPAAWQLNRAFNPKKIRFGIVGRINNQKGQKEVIELFESLNLIKNYPIELHVIGSGDNEILNWFKTIQSKNIFYHKFLDRYAIYDKFDFLISNASNEAFGRTIAEANYNGIPVVIRNSGAFPELVAEGVNGFVYNDLKALEILIMNLSKSKKTDFEKISKKSLDYAKENFNNIKLSKIVLEEMQKITIN